MARVLKNCQGMGEMHIKRKRIHASFQERDLATFLVGYWQHVLESSIAIPELIPAPLFCLNALASSCFLAVVSDFLHYGHHIGMLVFVRVDDLSDLNPLEATAPGKFVPDVKSSLVAATRDRPVMWLRIPIHPKEGMSTQTIQSSQRLQEK